MGDHVKRDVAKNLRIGIAPSVLIPAVLTPAGLTVVSLAALAGGGAHAAIVYDNGSPNQVNAPISTTQSYSVDFDQDGNSDVQFDVASASPGDNALKITLEGNPQTQVLVDSLDRVAALPSGALIGPNPTSGSYDDGSPDQLYDAGSLDGNFPPDTQGYIGFEFTSGLDSSLHYGWVQFKTTNGDESSLTGTVIDFAYDDSPNTPIAAGAVPEPTSLSLLAAGAAGLAMYRGRRRA